MRPKKRQEERWDTDRTTRVMVKSITIGKSSPKTTSKKKLLKRKLNQNLQNLQIKHF